MYAIKSFPSPLPLASKVTTSFLCGFPEIFYVYTANICKHFPLPPAPFFFHKYAIHSILHLGLYLFSDHSMSSKRFHMIFFTAAQAFTLSTKVYLFTQPPIVSP